MSVKKRGLGRGLDALLSSGSPMTAESPGDELRELTLEQLQPGKHQPRRAFNEEALAELANSIAAQGVVQPIVVRPLGGERYEIVAGERRWRAARLAGLKSIPAVIRVLDELGAMAVALVENIQRADLNPLEEAEALHKLIQECGLTHEAAATAVGRSRVSVTNLLRVMDLQPDVQQWLRDGKLTLGHAKVLLGTQGQRQSSLAQLVVDKQLTVRATESLVQAEPGRAREKPVPAPVGDAASALSQRIGLPVQLKQNSRGRGRIVFSFKNQAELDSLLSRIG